MHTAVLAQPSTCMRYHYYCPLKICVAVLNSVTAWSDTEPDGHSEPESMFHMAILNSIISQVGTDWGYISINPLVQTCRLHGKHLSVDVIMAPSQAAWHLTT